MKYSIKIQNVKTIDEVEKAWSTTDYRNLLEKFDYPDTQSINDAELKDYLFMAISDFEPNEAAAVFEEFGFSMK